MCTAIENIMLPVVGTQSEIMSCGKWDLESIITHEFSLCDLEKAIRTAADVDHAGNVLIKMAEK